MNPPRPNCVVIALAALALTVTTESRAQLDLTHQSRPTFEESPYSYAAALRIPRRDVRDLATLIERHVSPLVEPRGALAAGPYTILIETDGLEYVVQILTTDVPARVQDRLQAPGSPALRSDASIPSDEPMEPLRPDPTIRSPERDRGDSRAP